MERPDWAHFLCRQFTDFYLEDYTRAAEATDGRIDLYLILSDLHGNLDALETVLERASALAYDRTLILGDLVNGAFYTLLGAALPTMSVYPVNW